MQAGATNFLAVLQSMFPRMNVPPACMMRNCSKEQLSQVRALEQLQNQRLTLRAGLGCCHFLFFNTSGPTS